jgi:DNA-binding CsgD family transcriptional regulator
MISSEPVLDERDARALVRVLAEAAVAPGGREARRRRALDGLCRIIESDTWVWGLRPRLPAGRPAAYAVGHSGGLAPAQCARLMAAHDHPRPAEAPPPFAGPGDTEPARARFVRPAGGGAGPERKAPGRSGRPAGVGPALLSYRLRQDGMLSCIAFCRGRGRPRYGEREWRIARIMTDEVAWLHEADAAPERGADRRLAPRPRAALDLLICGRRRRDIAAELGISEHTANDYVRIVFQFLGVHSQAELMRRAWAAEEDGRTRGAPSFHG